MIGVVVVLVAYGAGFSSELRLETSPHYVGDDVIHISQQSIHHLLDEATGIGTGHGDCAGNETGRIDLCLVDICDLVACLAGDSSQLCIGGGACQGIERLEGIGQPAFRLMARGATTTGVGDRMN